MIILNESKTPSIINLFPSKNLIIFYLRTTFSVMVRRKICKIQLQYKDLKTMETHRKRKNCGENTVRKRE